MAGLNNELRVPKTVKLYINGEFPRTESGRSFPVYYAKSKNLFANLCLASRKDFRNSVTAALAAQKSWAGKSAYNRSQILYRMAEMAEGKRSEFLEVLTETVGLTKDKAVQMFDATISTFVYYAGFADKYQQVIGAVNPVQGPHHNFTTPEPVGVVSYIAGEKFDLSEIAAAISSIICSGNTVVALLQRDGAAILAPLAEVFATSDLPAGVVNLLSGDMDELYKHIGSHMEVNSLFYAGKDKAKTAELKVMAAENMKRVVSNFRKENCLENILQFVEFKTVWHPIGE